MPTDKLIQGEENGPATETGDTVIDISGSVQEAPLLMPRENDVVIEIPESTDRASNSKQRKVGLAAGFAASVAAAGGAAAAAGLTAALTAANVTGVISDKIAMIAKMTGEAAMKVVAEAAGAATETRVAETQVTAAIAAEVQRVVADAAVGEEGVISQAIAAGVTVAIPKIKLLAETISGAIMAAGPELAAAAETTVKLTEGVILGIVSQLDSPAALPASAAIGGVAAVVGAAVVAGVGIAVAKNLLAQEPTQNPPLSRAKKVVLTGAAITGGALAATGSASVGTNAVAGSQATAQAIRLIETVAKNAGTAIANATANLAHVDIIGNATKKLFRETIKRHKVADTIINTISNLTTNPVLRRRISHIGTSTELPVLNVAFRNIVTAANTAGAEMGVATGRATEMAITTGMASALAVSPALPVMVAAGVTATAAAIITAGTVGVVKQRYVNREGALREDVELNEIRSEYVNHGLENSVTTLHIETEDVRAASRSSKEADSTSLSSQNELTDQLASAIAKPTVAAIVKAGTSTTSDSGKKNQKENQKDLTKQKMPGKRLP